jgi:hypothetical protein
VAIIFDEILQRVVELGLGKLSEALSQQIYIWEPPRITKIRQVR